MKNSSAFKFIASCLLGLVVSAAQAWTPLATVPSSVAGTGRVHLLARKLTGTTLYPTIVLAGTGRPTSAPVLSARPGHWTCASGVNSWTCQRDLPVGTVPDDTLDLTWTMTGGTVAHLDSLRSSSATWTLTFSAQTPAAGAPGTQRGYAVLGLTSARISDQVQVAGAIGSSSSVEVGISDTTGDIESGNTVLLHDRSVVKGSVVYAGTITLGNGVVITGTSTRGTVVLPTIDQPACTPGTVDKNITSGKVALAPGAWNNVTVSAGAELDLSPGTYQLRSFVVQAGGKVVITATGNGTDILTTTSMNIGDRSNLTVASGSLAANVRWTYLGTGTFQLGTDIVMDGWLRAPKGTIDISSRTHVNGAVHAQTVTLEPQAYGIFGGIVNLPPVLTGVPVDSDAISKAWTFQPQASDPEGQTLTWTLVHGPTGATISGSGLVSWTPTVAQTGDFDVRVCDPLGACSEMGWTVRVITANHPPVITSTAPTTGKEAVVYAYTVTATDADGDALHFAAGTLQAGMTFDTTAHKLSWTPTFTQAGTYPVSVTVTDGKGGSITQSWNLVIADSNRAPVITSTPLTTGKKLVAYSYTVTATDADGDVLHFKAGTMQLGMSFDTTAHKFAWTPSASQLGTFPLSVTVTDGKGGSVTQSWNVVVSDTNHPPVITSTAPATGKEAVAYAYTVTATDADGDMLHFKAGTLQVGMAFDTIAHKLSWIPTFTQAGTYPVSVTVTDGKGGSVTQSWNLVIADSNRAPVVTSTATTAAIASVGYSYQAIATDADGDPTVWSLISGPTGLSINATGLVTWNPTASGNYPVQIQVSDGRGGSGQQAWTIQVGAPPPPVDTIPTAPIAPALPIGGVPPFVSQVSFLWSGSQPTIFGVITDSLDTARLAVLRGRVIGVDNAPIPGVRVQVAGHPEFGHTFTRTDGRYELVANGGVSVWADFGKSGFLPLQRLSKPFWKQYSGVLDVVLTKLDPVSTVVSMGSTQTQVATSTPRTDRDGTRMLSVAIPAGTHASFQMPDGSTVPATQLTLRATEYTVGPTGPSAMPSDLPSTSSYTYAFEVTADEELAAGAVHILFDRPVATHLENFRGFPVGSSVPYGVLNRTTHRWEAVPSGRVVSVLAITNGQAVLDVNGSGLAASSDTLAALSIDTAELRVIAGRFPIGSTLWRVQNTRFSGGDYNWFAEPGVAAPNLDSSNSPLHNPPPGDCSRPGCVLDLEQQRLGEDFALPGTGLSVHYRSDRSPNYIEDYEVRFRLSVPVHNPAFRGGIARLWVAGQEIHDSINRVDSVQYFTLRWDGRDAWGRLMNGSAQGQLDVSYNWAAIFGSTASFGGPKGGGMWAATRQPIEIVCPISTVMTVPLGKLHTPGLGVQGWSIDGVQSLDRIAGHLVGGDGTDHNVLAMGTGIGNLGIDSVTYFTEPRTGRQLSLPSYWIGSQIQSDGAGNIYFISYEVDVVGTGRSNATPMLLRRKLSGAIEIVVGSTNGVPIRENAPSDSVMFLGANGAFCVTRDGVVHFLDYSNGGSNVIWRRDLDGRVHRVFGGGTTVASDSSAMGKLGTDLSLLDANMINQWYVSSMAQDGDGRLHVIVGLTYGSTWRFMLSPAGTLEGRRASSALWSGYQGIVGRNAKDQALFVGANGCVGGCNTLAVYQGDTANFTWQGGSVLGYGGWFTGTTAPSFDDGSSSGTGYLGSGVAKSVSAAPGGTTYTLFNGSLVSMGSDSGVHQVAGVFQTAGGMSTNPRLLDLTSAQSVTVLPNGTVVLVTNSPGTNFLTIDPTAALMSQVPSEDGKLLYIFDNWARHTLTLDALTGDTIRRMSYDSAGRVTKIVDAYGNQTTLTYSANTIDIQAPGGQHTVLNLSGSQVVSVTGPDTHSDLLSWQNGLLASHTDPMGRTSQYGFDTLGNLTYDQRPDGKRVTLSNTFDLSAQTRVSMMTQPSGRTLQATTAFLPDKGSRTVIVGEEGDTSVVRRWATGDMETTGPDHTVTHITASQHPQFTSLVPLPGLITVTTPGGIVSQSSMKVGITHGSVPAYGPVRTWNDTTVTPSGTWLRAWDSLSRSWTLTDPQGRVSKIFVGRFGAVDSQRVPGLPTVSYTRDSRGRTTTVRQGGRVWRTVWGTANTVDSLVDPLGRAVSLRWDASMRSLGGTTPDGRILSLSRWADGSLAGLTPPGRKAHQFFTNSLGDDSLYLPPSVDSTGGGSLLWNWTTDRTLSGMGTPAGNFSVGRDSLGRAVTVIQPSDTTRIAYDSLGRVDSLRRAGQGLTWTWDGSLPLSETWTGAVTGSVSTTWDANFRPTAQTAAGNAIAYTYDPDGTLTHAGLLSLARDPVSGFASGDTVGSIIHRLGRNGQGEILADTVRSGSVILSLATFTRDSLGRILTKADSLNGTRTNWRYHYDLAGQLDSIWANGALSAWYGYDSNGVRLRGTGISGVTVDAQDRETAANGVAYGYDENGQMVSRSSVSGTTRYHYTLQGELLSVKLATGDSIAYTLDPAGRRIARSLNGVVTNRWLWNGSLRPVADVDSVGNILTRYVYAIHANVPDYLVRAGVTYRMVTDQLGSVRAVVNVATGTVVSSLNYDAWGNVTSSVNPSFQPFGFAGGLRDDATGLIRFGARDYMAELGRWTRKDPIGFNGGQSNTFGYVGNDPVNKLDLNGLWTGQCGLSIAGHFGPINLNGGIGFAFDGTGGIAIYTEGGLGGGPGAGASAGIHIAGSNANTVSDLAGPFQNGSFGLGAGLVSGAVEEFSGVGSNGNTVVGGGATIGIGVGGGASSGASFTSLKKVK